MRPSESEAYKIFYVFRTFVIGCKQHKAQGSVESEETLVVVCWRHGAHNIVGNGWKTVRIHYHLFQPVNIMDYGLFMCEL